MIIRTAFRHQQCYRSSTTVCRGPKPPLSPEPIFSHDWCGSLLANARFISCIEQAGLTSAQFQELLYLLGVTDAKDQPPMSFRLKLFHRRRERVLPLNASNGALPSVSTAAETSSAEPNPQLQSHFLTLLPFDVRLMVYEHVLVVKPRLHVVDWQAHVKLSYHECDEPENDSIGHRKCWNHLNGLSKMFKRFVITLGILQTCRIV